MNITYFDAVALNALCEKVENRVVSLKTAYKISKLSKKIAEELVFYNQKFNNIISKYAETDTEGALILNEDKTGVKIQEQYLIQCSSELKELQNFEIIIDDLSFNLEELENLNLSVKDIGILMPFIKE